MKSSCHQVSLRLPQVSEIIQVMNGQTGRQLMESIRVRIEDQGVSEVERVELKQHHPEVSAANVHLTTQDPSRNCA